MPKVGKIIRKIATLPAACHERYLVLDCASAQPLRTLEVGFAGVSDLVPGYMIGTPKPARLMVIATVSGSLSTVPSQPLSHSISQRSLGS